MSDEYSHFYRRIIIFENQNCKPLEKYFCELLTIHDFSIQEVSGTETQKGETNYVISQTNKDRILREAQYRKIKKPFDEKNKHPEMTHLLAKVFENESKRSFLCRYQDRYKADKDWQELYDPKKTDITYGFGLFSEFEMMYLEFKILEEIEVNEEIFRSIVNGIDELKPKIKDIENSLLSTKSVFYLLRDMHIIKESFPLHVSSTKDHLLKMSFPKLFLPSNLIRSYYGDKISLYYAWLQHYISYLIT